MITREEIIEIGQYNKAHGISGEISASFTIDVDVVESIVEDSCLISEINGIFVPFFVENVRPKTDVTLLLKIEGIDDEPSTKLLVNHKIYGLKSDLKEFDEDMSDEMPIEYFIGFTVLNEDNVEIGEIVDVDSSTENYLFIIDHNGTNVFVPAVDELILDMDLDEKRISMELPEGILEL